MDDLSFRLRSAATFRGILNDLKRNERVAADELGIDVGFMTEILDGKRAMPLDLVRRAASIWPINERDFFPIHDDAPTGIAIMRAQEAARTSRVLQRGGRDYYEYRDTAMSRVAMIRPEWIRMLNVVEDNDPLNKAVQWNNGHFLYQFTYFIGDVNYYYEWEGRKFCQPMSTGDSVFGMPYAPHSFSSRDGSSLSLILALTYGGRLCGDAQHELAVLGAEALSRLALPADSSQAMRAAQIRRFVTDKSVSIAYLAKLMMAPPDEIRTLVDGNGSGEADASQLSRLAEALGISARELEPSALDVANGVKIMKGTQAATWRFPDEADPSYSIKRLAGSRVVPHSESLELTALKTESSNDVSTFEVTLHQYGYVVGTSPILLQWESDATHYQETLFPGDSVYAKPFVAHRFLKVSGAPDDADGRILVLRIGGKVVSDVLIEASLVGAPALRRLISEKSLWYDPKGRN